MFVWRSFHSCAGCWVHVCSAHFLSWKANFNIWPCAHVHHADSQCLQETWWNFDSPQCIAAAVMWHHPDWNRSNVQGLKLQLTPIKVECLQYCKQNRIFLRLPGKPFLTSLLLQRCWLLWGPGWSEMDWHKMEKCAALWQSTFHQLFLGSMDKTCQACHPCNLQNSELVQELDIHAAVDGFTLELAKSLVAICTWSDFMRHQESLFGSLAVFFLTAHFGHYPWACR